MNGFARRRFETWNWPINYITPSILVVQHRQTNVQKVTYYSEGRRAYSSKLTIFRTYIASGSSSLPSAKSIPPLDRTRRPAELPPIFIAGYPSL